mgnify:CR=1 FL=1
MAWQNEMVRIVRHLINDLDSSNYTFTDDRLEESILVAAQLLLKEVDFDNTYTVDTDSLNMSPDPTTLATKDDAFINLTCLKATCIILGSEVRTNALNAIVVKDGPSSIDMRGISAGFHVLYKDMCAKYEHYIMQWKAGNSIAGQAILSPYSPASDNIGRTSSTNRSMNFE